VWPSDIEALRYAQTRLVDDLRNGQKNQEEAFQDYDSELLRVEVAVNARAEAALRAAEGGLSFAEGSGVAGTLTVLGGLALNHFRNNTRKTFAEQVVHQQSPPKA
jgi:hypothetical protein